MGEKSVFSKCKWLLLVLCMVLIPYLSTPAMSVNAETVQTEENEILFDKGVTGARSSMPREGEVNLLIFAVEFRDAPFEGDIKENLTDLFLGDVTEENPKLDPPQNLRDYYEQSSFGKLTFTGDIYTYTAPNARSYYDDNLNALMEELLADFQERIMEEAEISGAEADAYFNEYLERYDLNKDNILDGVYIYYTGGVENWGEQWWSYVSYWDNYEMGDYTFGSTCMLGHSDARTIMHETGHMLGLGDYYDYGNPGWGAMNGIAATDMMNGGVGDHNAFSKQLLGWLDADNVTIVTGGMETLQLEECSESGDCVIVLPEYDEEVGLYTEFFMITYREYTGINALPGFNMPEGGLCVYYVNATLNEDGTHFLYSSSAGMEDGTIPLIRQIHADGEVEHSLTAGSSTDGHQFVWPWMGSYEKDTCFFHEGDEWTPYTLPSSCFYGDSYFADREYTGIVLKNISIKDGIATFDVGMEEEQQSYEVTYTVESPSGSGSSILGFSVDMTFSTELSVPEGEWEFSGVSGYALTENVVTLEEEDGTVLGYLTARLLLTQPGFLMLRADDALKHLMEYEKDYSIVIPAGTFTDALGNAVPEVRLDYSTHREYQFTTDWQIEFESSSYSCRPCINEEGSGIILTYDYYQPDVLIINRMENFSISGTIDATEVKLALQRAGAENELGSAQLWEAQDGTWGIATWPENSSFTLLVFNEDGEVVKQENISFEETINSSGTWSTEEAYWVAENAIYVFSGDSYQRYPFDICAFDKNVTSVYGIPGAYRTEDGVTALHVWNYYSTEGYKYNETYILNEDYEIVCKSERFDSVAAFHEYNGKYYLFGRNSYHDPYTQETEFYSYVEVYDEDFRLIELYTPDISYGIRNVSKAGELWVVLSGNSTLYFFDLSMNYLGGMEEFPGAAIYQSGEDVIRFYGINYLTATGTGTSMDISVLDTDVENKNVVALGEGVILVADNVISVPKNKTPEYFAEALAGTAYEFIGTEDGIITEDTHLAVTSDNGVYTKYFYFEVEPADDVSSFVSRLYTVILDREAEEKSLAEWTGYLERGEFTGAEVAKGFIMSNEFLAKPMTNEEFVRILYSAFFGREADPEGLAGWVDFLNQGYRKSYVFSGFANSDEFAALCEGYGVEAGSVKVTISEQQPNLSEEDYNVWLFVERMYTEVLTRTPDMQGIQGWVTLLKAGSMTGAEVAEGFILSDEFLAKELSKEEYVQILYMAFFGREADSEGLAGWVKALETDYTKAYVFAGFANSEEFGALCDKYGITQGSVEIPER